MADDGKTYNIEKLPDGEINLSHSLDGFIIERKSLCFQTTDTHLKAFIDGKEVYSYAPEYPNILGKSYGKYIHMIPIPEDAKEVRLELKNVYGSEPQISRMAVENSTMFMGDIYHKGLPNFSLCALMAVFGVLMLIIGFTDKQYVDNNSNTLNFFSLGTFSILVAIWSANNTMVIQTFTQCPEIMRFVHYLCLIFIAYQPVSFMASATNHKDTVHLPIMMGLTLINFFTTIILSILGIIDVHSMLTFSHVNIVIALFMTIHLMIRAVKRKTVEMQFMRSILIGMSLAIVGVVADMVRFKIVPDSKLGSSKFTRIGVLLFIILVGFYLMRKRTRLAVERGQAEMMKKMAYSDGLTGLANRAAFHEKEDEIRKNRNKCYVMQFDINFLKKVNDVYGHAEGDRHIINAARIINESVGGAGKCFRTGGDEFIAVADGNADVDKIINKLTEGAENYNKENNPPVPLVIAYGYAAFPDEAKLLEEAEKLADRRMYDKKKALKAGN